MKEDNIGDEIRYNFVSNISVATLIQEHYIAFSQCAYRLAYYTFLLNLNKFSQCLVDSHILHLKSLVVIAF